MGAWICPTCRARFVNNSGPCPLDGSTLHEILDPRVGRRLADRFLIEKKISSTGTTIVFDAIDELDGRPVTVVALEPGEEERAAIDRFRLASAALAMLEHPTIVRAIAHGMDEGSPFLVTEALPGPSLDRVSMPRAWSIAQVVEIGFQLAEALSHAHERGILHRNVKPSHVHLVERDRPTVKLGGFAIARGTVDPRMTAAEMYVATPAYAAPEQVLASEPVPASDVYSLGVSIFELCSGQLPFEAGDVFGMLVQHAGAEPPSLRALRGDCPAELDALVVSMLAKLADDRPPAREVVQRLARLRRRPSP